jgi:hypothetical protein
VFFLARLFAFGVVYNSVSLYVTWPFVSGFFLIPFDLSHSVVGSLVLASSSLFDAFSSVLVSVLQVSSFVGFSALRGLCALLSFGLLCRDA